MSNELQLFNIAHIEYSCQTLGPGVRTVIWLQGCKKKCPSCINEGLQSFEEKLLLSPQKLLKRIMSNDHETKAVTLTGGEPFLQANSLAIFVKMVRQLKIPILIYTGFTLLELINSKCKNVDVILENIDVLIDGEYKKELKTKSHFKGSSNQNIYLFTNQYSEIDFASNNSCEISIINNKVKVIGFYNV